MKARWVLLVALFVLGFSVASVNSVSAHPSQVTYHEGEGSDGNSGGEYGNGNDNRRCRGENCRGSFSPGPFDRSPVEIHDNQICISPDCSNSGGDAKKDQKQRP